MKKTVFKFISFSILGALAGFGYYYFVGCQSGTCPITTNPYLSTLYGLLLGMILGFDTRLFKRQSDVK